MPEIVYQRFQWKILQLVLRIARIEFICDKFHIFFADNFVYAIFERVVRSGEQLLLLGDPHDDLPYIMYIRPAKKLLGYLPSLAMERMD